jgi:hypothetical protein
MLLLFLNRTEKKRKDGRNKEGRCRPSDCTKETGTDILHDCTMEMGTDLLVFGMGHYGKIDVCSAF